jgi:uncharacterized protein with NRDE domain
MCTALLSLNQNKKFPIILSFNRDEFYDRKSIPVKLYKHKNKNIIYGRDEHGKGSWLGCNNLGKTAFILNLISKRDSDLKKKSRGLIITKYLNIKNNNLFHSKLDKTINCYNPFKFVSLENNKVIEYNSTNKSKYTYENGIFSFTNSTNLIKWDKQKIGETFFKSLLNIYNVDLLKNKIFDFFDHQFPAHKTKKKNRTKSLIINEGIYGTKTISLIIKSAKKTYFFEKNLISKEIKKITMLSKL